MWENTLLPPSAASSPDTAAVGREAVGGCTARRSRRGVHRENMNFTSNIPLKDVVLEL